MMDAGCWMLDEIRMLRITEDDDNADGKIIGL
jgi:hypothetical protein